MSLARLVDHRRIWKLKPVLEDIYSVWFDALLAAVGQGGRVLEVGAGPGFLSEHARRARKGMAWIATDVTATPWNDVAADAQRLPFASASLDAVVALDVIHHLARPESFLAEASRVLRENGRIVVVEPWITALSYPIYRWLHQEGCTPDLDPRDPFKSSREASKDAFAGDAAVAWRLLKTTPAERWRELGLRPPRARILNGFAYILSLGFREASLLPRWLAPALIRLDERTSFLASFTGMRALIAWERP